MHLSSFTSFFFFNDTATTEIYTLSLQRRSSDLRQEALREALPDYYAKALAETEVDAIAPPEIDITAGQDRSEEHTSELQSPCNLVCRLLLEKKKHIKI